MEVLVLGANGVLGSQISALLMARGTSVLGTARCAESSAALPDGLSERLLVDVTQPSSIDTLTAYVRSRGPLGGVINAIGLVGFGTAAETDLAAATELMQVNHLGPAALISGLLPALIAAKEQGGSPYVASLTGIVAERPFPGMGAYAASKAAHSAWLASLRLEVRRSGVAVLDARPGHTETGLAGRARFGTAPRMPTGYAPEHVARVIVKGIDEGASELPSASFGQ